MSSKVFHGVLTLSEWKGGGRSKDTRTVFSRALVVRVNVFNTHHDRAAGGSVTLLSHDDCAITNVDLCAMVRDQDPKGELEDVAEPLYGISDICVREFGNNRA